MLKWTSSIKNMAAMLKTTKRTLKLSSSETADQNSEMWPYTKITETNYMGKKG